MLLEQDQGNELPQGLDLIALNAARHARQADAYHHPSDRNDGSTVSVIKLVSGKTAI